LLIQWAASKFEDATFVTYEQVYPYDGFGIVMQKHFESMNSPLLSIAKFPDLESQEHRYMSRASIAFSGSSTTQEILVQTAV
jgi:tRNA wybutosine-synthesizing protein 4